MNKLWLVGQREYIKIVRKPSFWLATLFFPVFIGVMSFISGYSAEHVEQKIKNEANQAQNILIIDESGLLSPALLVGPYQKTQDFDGALNKVKSGEVDALFVYPEDLLQGSEVRVYKQDDGILTMDKYAEPARQIIKQSILESVGDSSKVALFNSNMSVKTTNYRAGEELRMELEDYIVPVLSVVLYFVLVLLASNFLLMTVSEEKESRMMEIMLSTMKPRELIWGKIVGLIGVIFTQLVVLSIFSILILQYTSGKLPFEIDWSAVTIDPIQVLINLFYIMMGFLFISSIMVGVGSAMPSFRDAQSFSSVFIVLSILPIYFGSLIIADPSGFLSQVFSYIPFTSPLILLTRNALGGLPLWEVVVGSIVTLVYVIIGLFLAFKLFEIGSLEYSNKISFKNLLKRGK